MKLLKTAAGILQCLIVLCAAAFAVYFLNLDQKLTARKGGK